MLVGYKNKITQKFLTLIGRSIDRFLFRDDDANSSMIRNIFVIFIVDVFCRV